MNTLNCEYHIRVCCEYTFCDIFLIYTTFKFQYYLALLYAKSLVSMARIVSDNARLYFRELVQPVMWGPYHAKSCK